MTAAYTETDSARWAVYRKRAKLKRYQRRGLPGLIDATKVWAHVDAFIAEGWSEFQIAKAVGLSAETISTRSPRVFLDHGRKIASLTRADLYTAATPHSLVPAIGARRRLEALAAIGHPMRSVIRKYLADSIIGGAPTCQARTWRAIHDQYERLSMERGPSSPVRLRAARLGYAPPLAWDDDSIDDPGAVAQR